MSCLDCISESRGVTEYFKQLYPDGNNPNPLPLTGSIELTLRCNLRCRHCYILYPGATDNEMDTGSFKTVLKKMADGGVLFLLMTGGEPMLRPDFKELYLYAKQLGMVPAVYSNATLVDEDMIRFLLEYPPRRIEVTMYGHTESTYEKVTGIPGSFKRYRQGVQRLLESGITIHLKTMVMKSNVHEFDAMRAWALDQGVEFRFDTNIGPKLDHDPAPLLERVDPKTAIEIETREQEGFQQGYDAYTDFTMGLESGEELFMCGAGIRTCHVDPRGLLHPCMLWRKNPYDLLNLELNEAWRKHLWELRSMQHPAGGCTGCSSRGTCGRCPAASFLEMGDPTESIPYHCETSEERKRVFGKNSHITFA